MAQQDPTARVESAVARQTVIDGTLPFSWDGKACSFIASLESGLAVTDHPYSYVDLMGLSGLAFRVRWYIDTDGVSACTSATIGEDEEAQEQILKHTGWRLAEYLTEPETEITNGEEYDRVMKPQITSSIDAGVPVLILDASWLVALVCGYRNNGDVLLIRDMSGGEPKEFAFKNMIGWTLFLKEHRQLEGIDPYRRFIGSLRKAVHHWTRDMGLRADSSEPVYVHGARALEQWIHVLGMQDQLPAEKWEDIWGISQLAFGILRDARISGLAFLKKQDYTSHLNEEGQRLFLEAVGEYESVVGVLNAAKHQDPKDVLENLTEVSRLESQAIQRIAGVLDTVDAAGEKEAR